MNGGGTKKDVVSPEEWHKSHSISVKNLPKRFEEIDVEELFKKFGIIVSTNVIKSDDYDVMLAKVCFE